MVKVKQFDKLPPHFERIYQEVADIMRLWASEQKLVPIIYDLNEPYRVSASENAMGRSAITTFGCNRPNREFPEADPIWGDPSSSILFADLSFHLHLLYGTLHIKMEIRHQSLAEPGVLLAEMLEQHLRSWLPPEISLHEIEVEYKF